MTASESDVEAAFAFAEFYKQSFDTGKTERPVCSVRGRESLEAEGFVPLFSAPAGGIQGLSHNQRQGSMMPSAAGPCRRVQHSGGAHRLARIDLKPIPLYEDGELALLKNHYHGGIKKYQWTAGRWVFTASPSARRAPR